MAIRKRGGSLTHDEKQIVKALLASGWHNQDIQDLVNRGRDATINSARVTEVKKDAAIEPASADTIEFYQAKKRSYDWSTGLNLYDHERLIRAREAMVLAVHVFNSPTFRFKTELFAVLANIAWTYLLHEYYHQSGVQILGADGRSLLLSQMVDKQDCPLTEGMRNNLKAIKAIRDEVEHLLLRKSDIRWVSIFQACCLNFDRKLTDLFGESKSLRKELSLALQFAKLDMEQISEIQKFDIPEEIDALDARLNIGMTEQQLADLEYQFKVVYTLDNASKSKAGIQFIKPGTEEAQEIRNVLLKYKMADEVYPHKPSAVAKIVTEKSGKKFSVNNNTQAWKLYKVRPINRAKVPDNTNRDFCIYHAAHNDYTYSEKWIEFLVDKISLEEEFAKIKKVRV